MLALVSSGFAKYSCWPRRLFLINLGDAFPSRCLVTTCRFFCRFTQTYLHASPFNEIPPETTDHFKAGRMCDAERRARESEMLKSLAESMRRKKS
jgi:hypothetical protein